MAFREETFISIIYYIKTVEKKEMLILWTIYLWNECSNTKIIVKFGFLFGFIIKFVWNSFSNSWGWSLYGLISSIIAFTEPMSIFDSTKTGILFSSLVTQTYRSSPPLNMVPSTSKIENLIQEYDFLFFKEISSIPRYRICKLYIWLSIINRKGMVSLIRSVENWRFLQ